MITNIDTVWVTPTNWHFRWRVGRGATGIGLMGTKTIKPTQNIIFIICFGTVSVEMYLGSYGFYVVLLSPRQHGADIDEPACDTGVLLRDKSHGDRRNWQQRKNNSVKTQVPIQKDNSANAGAQEIGC